MSPPALVWFRRDLRDVDHAPLAAALAAGGPVYCAFVFDATILAPLPRDDCRVAFIHASLQELDAALRARGGGLLVRHGDPRHEIPALAAALGAGAVYAGRDYEPAAKARDAAVAAALAADGRRLELLRDQAVLDGDAVLTQAGTPFTVFTRYRDAWLKRLRADDLAPRPSAHGRLAEPPLPGGVPPLAAIGFTAGRGGPGVAPGMSGAQALFDEFRGRLARYREQRDFPAAKGVSYLSAHLRFGTVSIRALAAHAWQEGGDGAMAWLSELIWRDFYFMILDRFPHVIAGSFRPAYDRIAWDDWPEGLAAWQAGRTGYPLVDAAMRQLAATGYMHNRLRMVAASFLCKDLGIDWRHGEAWFAGRLLDFDLAANNGGWQWAASSGCDAQPWFRIFNPVTQSEKFDPRGAFIRRYVPELETVPDQWIHAPWRMPAEAQQACGVIVGRDYPPPLVDHAAARERTLARYAVVKKAG
ncbi:cryptochrome/photolyase family protein [Azospira restricta]|uniref:Deoxyribodipyrimidine photo-lyase n=1 Tax=Azospira restricta TaxID=404405 RepID=A0A974SPU0_9RHOO|nr:deoxyribodipyrimidine photo-lyase [Azospira restricta]QRJ64237.1 deoxyribodipyrimidine photo-lyase [Azospira restricta]